LSSPPSTSMVGGGGCAPDGRGAAAGVLPRQTAARVCVCVAGAESAATDTPPVLVASPACSGRAPAAAAASGSALRASSRDSRAAFSSCSCWREILFREARRKKTVDASF
jgi:hypothetical protein